MTTNIRSLCVAMSLTFLALTLFTVNLMAQAASDINGPQAFAQTVITLDNEDVMLRELAGTKGTLVVFSCNTCPFVIKWEDRYNDLYDLAKANGINMILVNSNEAFRGGDDSHEKMKEHAKKMGYKMPYVIDQNHVIADILVAKATPQVYLFDNNFRIVYRGAIDDNQDSADDVQETYAADAITALANDDKIAVTETKALGCSIKRVKK